MKKSLIQTIKELIKQGEEINAEKLTFMLDDLIDEEKKSAIQSTAPKNQKLTYVQACLISREGECPVEDKITRKDVVDALLAAMLFLLFFAEIIFIVGMLQ